MFLFIESTHNLACLRIVYLLCLTQFRVREFFPIATKALEFHNFHHQKHINENRADCEYKSLVALLTFLSNWRTNAQRKKSWTLAKFFFVQKSWSLKKTRGETPYYINVISNYSISSNLRMHSITGLSLQPHVWQIICM